MSGTHSPTQPMDIASGDSGDEEKESKGSGISGSAITGDVGWVCPDLLDIDALRAASTFKRLSRTLPQVDFTSVYGLQS